MKIKEVKAKTIKDSRGEKTISVSVKTSNGIFTTSAPEGKSVGEYEAKSYDKNLSGDIDFLNNINIENLNEIIGKFGGINSADKAFDFLEDIERFVYEKIGANSLFALESCLLKAIASENKLELWEFLLGNNKIRFPRPVGNAIGGGLHSRGISGKKPDFQEFLFISNGDSFSRCVELNEKAYNLAGKLLKKLIKRRNDEGAFETKLSNEEVLEIMERVREKIKTRFEKVDIGVDIAASSFFKDGFYEYKNFHKELDRNSQISYIAKIIKKFNLFYVEDALEDNDFNGFAELMFEVNKTNCLIVGDDLTVTNPHRLEKAIRFHSINALIVKPNQIGSLIKVKRVIEIAKKNKIKTVISHRSGETMDDTIADLCLGFGCDFIKTGIYGPYRKVKLKRLVEIEKSVEKK